jgi:hypothetical protein
MPYLTVGLFNMITQELLKSLHDYNPETGEYTSKRTKKQMGTMTHHGYLRTTIKGKRYFIHKLIWLWMTGEYPSDMIVDHIDRNRLNNCWDNLRLCNKAQNAWNRLQGMSVVGFKGVYKTTKGPNFFSQIMCCGESIYLGTFPTAKEASDAYQLKAAELFGEYSPG